jgi:hypothetical protein
LLISWLLRALTAAGLAIDAYVHADLASRYDLNQGTAAISQGDLFRIEAGLSALAALAIILTTWRLTWLFAFLVAASGLGALLFYRYTDPGMLGPLPDMYEPIMYPEKSLAAFAEGVAAVTALLGFTLHTWVLPRTNSDHPPAGVEHPGRPAADREARKVGVSSVHRYVHQSHARRNDPPR